MRRVSRAGRGCLGWPRGACRTPFHVDHRARRLRQHAQADLAGNNLLTTDPERQAHGEVIDIGHLRDVLDEQAGPLPGHLQGHVGKQVVALQLVPLGGEGADDADAAKVFLHDLGHQAHLVLIGEPGVAQLQPGDAGAGAGVVGENSVVCADGKIETLMGNDEAQLDIGDVFVMKTPGGGGYGSVKS